MKKIFLLLSIFSLFFLTSCEKKLESWEKISQLDKNIFSSKNFLASVNWDAPQPIWLPGGSTSTASTSTDLTSTASTSTDSTSTASTLTWLWLINVSLKNKWVRDCTEQDFKCKWADNTCKFWLWQDVWWCNFWCWIWNDNVDLRKDIDWKNVICNEKSNIWKTAKENAKNKCLNIIYIWATANGTFCRGVKDQNNEKDLVCICNNSNNRWILDSAWKSVKTTYESPFCKIEWDTKIVQNPEKSWAIYLATCTKQSDWFNYWLPDNSGDWSKWIWWFETVWWVKCDSSNDTKTKTFYATAISAGICADADFKCLILKKWWSWAWILSADDKKEYTVKWHNNKYKATDFIHTECNWEAPPDALDLPN